MPRASARVPRTLTVGVTSRSFSKHAILRRELTAQCPSVRFNDDGARLTGVALAGFLRGCEAAIVGLEPVTEKLLEELPELRVISKYGVGLDGLDLRAMSRRGVALGWTPGVNRRSVAELALSCIIALLRRLPHAVSAVQAGRWEQVRGRELSHSVLGVVGCGNVGQELVRLVQPFGTTVLVNDIEDRDAFCRETGARSCALDELLASADVVSLHVPLDGSTRGMLSASTLRAMKPGAVLVNTARGGLVDEREVGVMLNDGHLSGAAFDVLTIEPPMDSSFSKHPGIIVTPHIGGSSEDAVLAMGRAAIEGLRTARIPGPAWPGAGH